MNPPRTLSGMLLWCLALLPVLGVGAAQQPAKEEPEEPKKLNKAIEDSVSWYDVFPDGDAKTALTPVPVARWRNVVRGQEGEAMMVVWPHNGRPIAVASIYPWDGKMNHEFDSLSRTNKLLARDKDKVIWSPGAAGVEFKEVPKAPKPAKTAVERLLQMKAIAEGFKATMTGWMADNSDQQLLVFRPKPLYRYDLTNAKDHDPPLLDGALFAYAQDTDPEVVLVLEAVGTKDEPAPKAPGESPKPEKATWQYAFVRATSGGLEVKLGEDVVWSAKKYPQARDPKLPHFTAQRVMEKEKK